MAEHDHKRSELDDERRRFIHHAMRQLIEELSDEAEARQTRSDAAATEQEAKDGPAPDTVAAQRIPVPNDCEINVLCLPAADEADEISGLMLAQVLEHHGYCAINVAVAALASEMVSMVEEKHADLVCVCAMPPAAVAHARYLCKRLHARHAELKIIVGLWMLKGDREKARRRITGVESAPLCVSLTEAMNQIEQLAHSALVAARSGVKA
jgi:methylmalonyl-CoA mutase cobalamin-binding subunit